ncbi:MAG TPA: type II toxin-antitoxin system VapC family toxin [Patescibacteria group bacterium]|nr:type II toxin-antitoxin system VapC family toxin [Patescibacteria group bacterium]
MTNNLIIVDASIAVKWFIPEPDWEKAKEVLDKSQKDASTILVPSLFYYEIGNVFLTKHVTQEDIKKFINELSNLPISIYELDALSVPVVYAIAKKCITSFYDAMYLFLMIQRQCPFVTADKKLYDKTKNDFPNIQLL